jgi:8-oxo-dGTP pyrophosphatase MutT (NUDIX family)
MIALGDNVVVPTVPDVTRVLEHFPTDGDGEAAKSRDLTLSLLAWSPQPFSRRTFTPGHITCTGVVLDPAREAVLLVHHRRLDRWLLPGGHVEPEDSAIWHTAHREVVEETGAVLGEYPGLLVGVDVHAIPGRGLEPLHLHHDLIFAFHAISNRFTVSEECREVTWCRICDYGRYDLPGSIRRSVERALDWL